MIRQISVDNLIPFKESVFSLEHNLEMEMLIDSVKEIGIINPIIVRKVAGGYEVISGNRRVYAAMLAELEVVPAIVKDLTDEEANIVMVDSNLHRENIRPSEKGFAYRLRVEAIEKMAHYTHI